MRTRNERKTALLAVAAAALLVGAVSARAAEITVGDGSAAPNGQGTITVRLVPGEGEAVAGTQNDIQFESGAQVAEATVTATTLTANISDTDTAIPVADASGLPFFGTIQIEDERIAYGAIEENTLKAGGCAGVDVAPTACATVDDCPAGATCDPVGRGQNDTEAAAHTSGADVTVPSALPDCAPTAAVKDAGKRAVFAFLPADCTPGTDCTAVRGIVLALDDLTTLDSPIDLYTCKVQAGPDAGTFPLTCPADPSCEPGQTENCTPDPFAPAQAAALPGEPAIATTCTSGEFTVGVSCIGDCGAPVGEVSLGEVQRAFNIFLGTAGLDSCPAADGPDANTEVSLGEVQIAFNNFLNGCP